MSQLVCTDTYTVFTERGGERKIIQWHCFLFSNWAVFSWNVVPAEWYNGKALTDLPFKDGIWFQTGTRCMFAFSTNRLSITVSFHLEWTYGPWRCSSKNGIVASKWRLGREARISCSFRCCKMSQNSGICISGTRRLIRIVSSHWPVDISGQSWTQTLWIMAIWAGIAVERSSCITQARNNIKQRKKKRKQTVISLCKFVIGWRKHEEIKEYFDVQLIIDDMARLNEQPYKEKRRSQFFQAVQFLIMESWFQSEIFLGYCRCAKLHAVCQSSTTQYRMVCLLILFPDNGLKGQMIMESIEKERRMRIGGEGGWKEERIKKDQREREEERTAIPRLSISIHER